MIDSKPSIAKVSATCAARCVARWCAHTKLFPTELATACSSLAPTSAQFLVGSVRSMTSSVRCRMRRNRDCRSCSTSVETSVMPSPRTCCHSAVWASASSASRLRRSRSEVSSSRLCGSCKALSSASRVSVRCSDAEPISAIACCRVLACWSAMALLRKVTSAGKFDSVLSSLSLSCNACERKADETAIAGTAILARCR
ncbi:Uncharacterised protein [Mycobacteroides abscessus subsp. abscessus]|nr:Uncharacterised protein [Mycobacteroides abscessus subsp. abscessus]